MFVQTQGQVNLSDDAIRTRFNTVPAPFAEVSIQPYKLGRGVSCPGLSCNLIMMAHGLFFLAANEPIPGTGAFAAALAALDPRHRFSI
jgi:hypothetical protein